MIDLRKKRKKICTNSCYELNYNNVLPIFVFLKPKIPFDFKYCILYFSVSLFFTFFTTFFNIKLEPNELDPLKRNVYLKVIIIYLVVGKRSLIHEFFNRSRIGQ